MSTHIIIDIKVNTNIDVKLLRENLQHLIRENCNHCDCNAIRSWIEKRE